MGLHRVTHTPGLQQEGQGGCGWAWEGTDEMDVCWRTAVTVTGRAKTPTDKQHQQRRWLADFVCRPELSEVAAQAGMKPGMLKPSPGWLV